MQPMYQDSALTSMKGITKGFMTGLMKDIVKDLCKKLCEIRMHDDS